MPAVKRIVSGGQTGVDQAALQAARDLHIEHGGWCPRGRRCEVGQIPARFKLIESHSSKYQVRTEQNIVDSDATLILFRGQVTGGTALTARLAKRHQRPCLQIDLAPDAYFNQLRLFDDHGAVPGAVAITNGTVCDPSRRKPPKLGSVSTAATTVRESTEPFCTDRVRVPPVRPSPIQTGSGVTVVRRWLIAQSPQTLNVAGPRESGMPGIYDEAYRFLLAVFRD